ncbi:hypothetical protein AKJ66_03045 [candidate division MSBL1 archaeon SCGC-AAA259E22]|uniref:Uncharacterized protein n=1 Tax=candidate division MSBL1 archaeon SCGC-AAA259E22 TaxID=1698265 RepID=A0A133UFM5_9EURY|nr:hypothetical protein AKJ66_03045 [candidate division MSBL1 archaeon SCGC-AAA259E22]
MAFWKILICFENQLRFGYTCLAMCKFKILADLLFGKEARFDVSGFLGKLSRCISVYFVFEEVIGVYYFRISERCLAYFDSNYVYT